MDTPDLNYSEYRVLVEQAPIMIWRANTQAKCDYFNERWLAFTGRSMTQELGDGWAEGVHPDDLPRCLDIYQNSFERREIFEMTYRLRRHDGAWRWIFDRGVPLYDAQGQFAGYIGSCHDITERVEAETALRLNRERELEQLRCLLPICAVCKKIRSENGQWERIEMYISGHARVDFSHGICPSCSKTLYPELALEVGRNEPR